jgi:hypothetical protein
MAMFGVLICSPSLSCWQRQLLEVWRQAKQDSFCERDAISETKHWVKKRQADSWLRSNKQGWTECGGSGNRNDNWCQALSSLKMKCSGVVNRTRALGMVAWWRTIELRVTCAGGRGPHIVMRVHQHLASCRLRGDG